MSCSKLNTPVPDPPVRTHAEDEFEVHELPAKLPVVADAEGPLHPGLLGWEEHTPALRSLAVPLLPLLLPALLHVHLPLNPGSHGRQGSGRGDGDGLQREGGQREVILLRVWLGNRPRAVVPFLCVC